MVFTIVSQIFDSFIELKHKYHETYFFSGFFVSFHGDVILSRSKNLVTLSVFNVELLFKTF